MNTGRILFSLLQMSQTIDQSDDICENDDLPNNFNTYVIKHKTRFVKVVIINFPFHRHPSKQSCFERGVFRKMALIPV
jgi:hypothetical protein